MTAHSSDIERFWAKVDTSGDCWLWTAARLPKGYGRFFAKGTLALAHRWSFETFSGPIPAGMHVDHTCYTPSCVRPDHLRAVTPKQNIENRGHLSSNNTSGIRGVSWSKCMRKWRVDVKHRGVGVYVGCFDSLAEAESAAVSKRLELFTHNDVDRAAITRRAR